MPPPMRPRWRRRGHEVGDPGRGAHRPGGLRLAAAPLHRPGGQLRVRRRPGRGALRCDPVRHARGRARPPRWRLQLRDHPAPLPAGRSGAVEAGRAGARGRPGRRALRRPRGPRAGCRAARAVDDLGRPSGAGDVRAPVRRPLRVPPAGPAAGPGTGMTTTENGVLPTERVGLWRLVGYFLTLGTIGFGGPVALTGSMHRDLVEQRRWISEEEYKEGLALAQLAPGPLAAQLAIYLGYARHGLLGATLVGLAFPAPSFVMVLAAGWAYVTYQGLDWLQALFYGVGAAVIAIIAHQAAKLTRRTLGRDRLLAAIFLVVAAVTVITESENGLLILAAGVVVWLVRARPRRLRFPGRGRGLAALLPLSAAVTAPAGDPGVL